VFGAHQTPVDIPDCGISNHPVGKDLDPILQPHPISVPILDKDFIDKLVVDHLSTIALESFFQCIGQHLCATSWIINTPNVVINKHCCCQNSRGLFGSGIGIGGAQFIVEIK